MPALAISSARVSEPEAGPVDWVAWDQNDLETRTVVRAQHWVTARELGRRELGCLLEHVVAVRAIEIPGYYDGGRRR